MCRFQYLLLRALHTAAAARNPILKFSSRCVLHACLRRCFKSLHSSRTSVNLWYAVRFFNSTRTFMSLSELRRWYMRRYNICTAPAELLAERILFFVSNQVGVIGQDCESICQNLFDFFDDFLWGWIVRPAEMHTADLVG
ncbi:hypothetical protein BDR03DRAFT_970946 [Suillus americanus]|nr:hypothetical protein BDR03DRAFT_970946 [Suillus americanus]